MQLVLAFGLFFNVISIFMYYFMPNPPVILFKLLMRR